MTNLRLQPEANPLEPEISRVPLNQAFSGPGRDLCFYDTALHGPRFNLAQAAQIT